MYGAIHFLLFAEVSTRKDVEYLIQPSRLPRIYFNDGSDSCIHNSEPAIKDKRYF